MRGAIASLLAVPLLAAAQDAGGDRELAELLGRIEAIEQELDRDMRAKGQAEAELRDTEIEIMRLREESAEVERQLAASRQKRSRLEADLSRNGDDRRQARQALTASMRLAWRSGRQEELRALLSGESAGEVDRRLAWAGMLVRSWARRAGDSARLAGERRSLTEESGSLERELAGLQARRAGQIRMLEQAAARRRATVAELARRIGAAGDEIGRLRSRAATLASLVENLGEAIEEHPPAALPSITAARGQLSWPVDGSVVRRFGAGLGAGRASWDGILLEASEGAEVRAPHAGRVVFADWVRGLGFLLVLDHGENVMSLYAYNDRLVGRKGETVDKGQIIAHAGSSGGRPQPGLYFEIRRNGKPEDPIRWLSR
ncbi:MAG: peptidoglycan DD-metalloendopeptidase family protein [Gammaproteobacteria bacterium]|nr:peptidoglycan DD-metalloendopeptidase family protein [Gammaproteobacteria bacterium]MXW46023.1 peptidoglycan DD-metalloendopeptidase family protein [Gammaproteobacteria bacterium]MYD02414.1 peptidoglycan DD-metalloendopeptidase family protein [Gammaproteobacteria bacterium]MYI25900.1 peptidoglycan DD-metalloendopeptidase family protein [Gammaproteobacteria bacterium]